MKRSTNLHGVFTHEPESVHDYMTCNFNCIVETEGLLKVAGSHMHCKCGNFSESEIVR